ncbi:hypothetical protein Y032_0014g2197 [Ancylostoma ceylanicum]|uniref:Uncharacterized protein n=1 Tax=Ancylostoma ceylanicum TaxID=53326 RepID=A0A016V9C0_9BILA|nr:hypothetical protein Y032_0014g2197 [Ancylostoma ceylanicum]
MRLAFVPLVLRLQPVGYKEDRLQCDTTWQANQTMSDEGPLLVYYNYHSVPISQEKIESLIKHVVIKLSAEFDKFYFCCDVRATPKDITDYAEHFQHGEIAHMSLSAEGSIEEPLCQRMLWHASTMSGAPGLIALVSGTFNELRHSWGLTLAQVEKNLHPASGH